MRSDQKKLDSLTKEIYLIKNNHLRHMDERIQGLDAKIEKMDQRLWAILIILIGSVLIGMLK
jgi:hypothetical protein